MPVAAGKPTRRDLLKWGLSFLALSTAGGVASGAAKPAPAFAGGDQREGLPNILILVFDTLSAPHMSLHGYRRRTTPNLARFARRATVFHRHYAGGNFTLPGTASLLTGTYPWSHRGLHLFGTVRDEYVDKNLFHALNGDYFTTAFTHNPLAMSLFAQFHRHLDLLTPPKDLALMSEPVADRLFSTDFVTSFWGERVVRGSGAELPGSLFLSFIEQDFRASAPQDLERQYERLYPRGLPTNSLGLFFLLEDAIDRIMDQVADAPRPFLGYFHLLPPHEPYRTRAEFAGMFDDDWKPKPKPVLAFSQRRSRADLNRLRRYYDEYLAYVDAEFGRLCDSLDRSGLLDDTYFILTSDHGQLFERGIHGHVTSTLYDPLIRIPLLICKPGQKKQENVFAPTSCVDVLPTLLHVAGKPVPDWCEGQILPTFGAARPDAERNIYAVEAKKNPKAAPLKVGTVAWIQGRYKLIHYLGEKAPRDELYDLHNDPEEREDLYFSRKSMAAELKDQLATKLAAVDSRD